MGMRNRSVVGSVVAYPFTISSYFTRILCLCHLCTLFPSDGLSSSPFLTTPNLYNNHRHYFTYITGAPRIPKFTKDVQAR